MNPRALVGLLSAIALVLTGVLMLRDATLPSSITVRWESGSEEDVAGFNLWRTNADDPTDRFDHRINASLIPAEGSPLQGAAYAFVDTDVDAGGRYRYQIEEVSPAGVGMRHPDTIEALAADRRRERIQGGLALLIGVVLFAMHIRDRIVSEPVY